MVLYLERDGLVRLYVNDRGREAVRRAVHDAEAVATTAIGYPWVRAWLAEAARAGWLNASALPVILSRFDLDWDHLVRIPASDALLRLAGQMSERWAVGGRAAVELASALVLRQYLDGTETGFATCNRRLARAATEEGLRVIPSPLLSDGGS